MIYEDERATESERLGFVLHLGDFIYEIVWYPEDRPTYYDRRIREVVRYPHGEKIRDFHVPTCRCGITTNSAGRAFSSSSEKIVPLKP